MSCNEWETAKITLPSASVAGLKKALRDHTNKFHAEVRAEAVRLHKSMGTRSVKKYEEALRAAEVASWNSPRNESMAEATARSILSSAVYSAERRIANGETGVTMNQPTVADVEREAPRATNRTTTFYVHTERGGVEATITFDGRVVTWSVEENNRAVENAHEGPLARVFFAYLARITWTRGTGGYGVGNNEYNRGDDAVGGGGNYLTLEYGPLGEAEHAYRAGVSLPKYREMKRRSAQRTRWSY